MLPSQPSTFQAGTSACATGDRQQAVGRRQGRPRQQLHQQGRASALTAHRLRLSLSPVQTAADQLPARPCGRSHMAAGSGSMVHSLAAAAACLWEVLGLVDFRFSEHEQALAATLSLAPRPDVFRVRWAGRHEPTWEDVHTLGGYHDPMVRAFLSKHQAAIREQAADMQAQADTAAAESKREGEAAAPGKTKEGKSSVQAPAGHKLRMLVKVEAAPVSTPHASAASTKASPSAATSARKRKQKQQQTQSPSRKRSKHVPLPSGQSSRAASQQPAPCQPAAVPCNGRMSAWVGQATTDEAKSARPPWPAHSMKDVYAYEQRAAARRAADPEQAAAGAASAGSHLRPGTIAENSCSSSVSSAVLREVDIDPPPAGVSAVRAAAAAAAGVVAPSDGGSRALSAARPSPQRPLSRSSSRQSTVVLSRVVSAPTVAYGK